MIDDAMRKRLAEFPTELAVVLTELLCSIENLKAERDRLKDELLQLKLERRVM